MAGRREGWLHVGPEPEPHKLGHRLLAQRGEHEDLGRRVGGQRRKQRRTLMRLGGPRRGDDRDRQFIKSSPQVVQEAQRGRVSPVDIVDAQQQRGVPPEVRAEPVEPVQDRERGVEQRAGDIILRRGDAEQRRRAPGRAGQELGSFRRRCRDERALEQLAHQAIREVSLEFRAARAQRRQAKFAAMPSSRQNQARLANARRALEQEQRTAPCDRVTQALIDPGQSGLSLQECLPTVNCGHDRSYRRQKSSVHPGKSRWSPTS